MVKFDLGTLFPEEQKIAATSFSADWHPLSEAEVRGWRHDRGDISVLIADSVECSKGLKETGAVVKLDTGGAYGHVLAFVHEGKLYRTGAKVLLAKAPNLLRQLREKREDGQRILVYIERKVSVSGRAYYDFKLAMSAVLAEELEEREQERHTKVPGVCWTDNHQFCFTTGRTKGGAQLTCTRVKGHSGLHHGASATDCYGSWK